jgi:hypothetical protein
MSSTGTVAVIVKDYKAALTEFGYPEHANKIELLAKHPSKFNSNQLIANLKTLGYQSTAPILDRPSLAYDTVSTNSAAIIDLFETAFGEIKTNTKFNLKLSQEAKDVAWIVVAFLAIITSVILLWNTVDAGYIAGRTDGIVLRSSAKSFYGGRDLDTSDSGILSLMVVKTVDQKASERTTADIYKVIEENLYVQTEKPTKGKLKFTNDPTVMQPYEIVEFETIGELMPNTLLHLTTHVESVEWLK